GGGTRGESGRVAGCFPRKVGTRVRAPRGPTRSRKGVFAASADGGADKPAATARASVAVAGGAAGETPVHRDVERCGRGSPREARCRRNSRWLRTRRRLHGL